ncbi:hypothetical protein DL766_005205 [Monosporascus sp. MC13-8B]|uniref:Uncharacterized protein n=1 Tax=Monosporascus cannonballus TaxID=155416 RepID=A0ABY0HGM7_9PEZI|nr:hypothetical protein DL763_011259 [Monosporascus cannonballus]RYO92145.1 hypothetical protein DL762_001803 [Monosporascus cannonballus]RYP29779.1 hypothetical protein DL766_005205 [Monosporascus sp. MC13-8B]
MRLPRDGISDDAYITATASGAVVMVAAVRARLVAAAAENTRAGDAEAIVGAIAKGAAETALAVANCFAAHYPTNEILVTTVTETAGTIIAAATA